MAVWYLVASGGKPQGDIKVLLNCNFLIRKQKKGEKITTSCSLDLSKCVKEISKKILLEAYGKLFCVTLSNIKQWKSGNFVVSIYIV